MEKDKSQELSASTSTNQGSSGLSSPVPPTSDKSIDNWTPFSKLISPKRIGVGAFSTVYRCRHADWGCEVAYKKLNIKFVDPTENIEEQKIIRRMKREVNVHVKLRHPNIVIMMGFVFEEDNYGLVLEYLPYGNLDAFIKSEITRGRDTLPWILKCKLSHEIASGLSYLHSLRPSAIIHGDVKLENILLGEHFCAKLSDFGLSEWKEYTQSCSSSKVFAGTTSHIPPEKWKNPSVRPDERFDIYSFAILLWELFANDKAFKDCRDIIRSLVLEGERPEVNKIPVDVPRCVSDLITDCWKQDPSERPRQANIINVLEMLITGLMAENELRRTKSELSENLHKYSNSSNTAQTAHGAKIQRVRKTLLSSVRRTDKIVSLMFEKKTLSERQQQTVLSQLTITDKVECLLDLITAGPLDRYQCFLDALRSTNQEYLCQAITDTSYDVLTLDQHRQQLISNNSFLIEELNLRNTSLLDHLIQCRVLDEDEVELIRANRVNSSMNQLLLTFISRTSAEQYHQFLDALIRSRMQHVYDTLTGALVSGQITKEDPPVLKSRLRRLGRRHRTEIDVSSRAETTARGDDSSRQETSKADDEWTRRMSRLSVVDSTEIRNTTSRSTTQISSSSTQPRNYTPTSLVATSLLRAAKVIHTIDERFEVAGKSIKWVLGLGIIDDELFVVRYWSQEVEVYNLKTFKSVRQIPVSGMKDPRDLIACPTNNCLYISDNELKLIYKVKLSDNYVTSWSVVCSPWGLSLTSDNNILVTINEPPRIRVYSTSGHVVQMIKLDPSIDEPHHSVQLSTGEYAVCHWGRTKHRVCLVDQHGHISQSYGYNIGSSVGQLNYPAHIARDRYDNVFVADELSDKLLVLSSQIVHLGDVTLTNEQLYQPCRLCLDEENCRLLIGRCDGKVLIVSYK